jgi:hypothetical protein
MSWEDWEDTTYAERQKRYVDRQRGDGMTQIRIWVPSECRILMLKYARQLREMAYAKGDELQKKGELHSEDGTRL